MTSQTLSFPKVRGTLRVNVLDGKRSFCQLEIEILVSFLIFPVKVGSASVG